MGFSNFFNISSREASRARTRGEHTDYNRPAPTAIIYQGELDYISRCILDYPDIETGGQLFGFWTSTGTPVVAYAIGPGRNAQHNQTSFVQDPDYVQAVGLELHRRYRLQHIGEWHSHHQLGLAHPSGGDVNTMIYGVGKPGFPRMLLCIGNCTRTSSTLNPFNFHESNPHEYEVAAWDIVNGESPYRRVADADLRGMLLHPRTLRASHGRLRTVENTATGGNGQQRQHWLTENADNVETMKQFVAMVQGMMDGHEVKVEVTADGEPQMVVPDANVCIRLPYGFPQRAPQLLQTDGSAHPARAEYMEWEIGEEPLTATMGRWLTGLYPQIAPQQPAASPEPAPTGEQGRQAQEWTERIEADNDTLASFMGQKMYTWSMIDDKHVVNAVAYPYEIIGPQYVVRLELSHDYPQQPPTVQYGVYVEDPLSAEPVLRSRLAHIKYSSLSSLFEQAQQTYAQLLDWNPKKSILEPYLTACVLLAARKRAMAEGRTISELIDPLLNDPSELTSMKNEFSQGIIMNRNL